MPERTTEMAVPPIGFAGQAGRGRRALDILRVEPMMSAGSQYPAGGANRPDNQEGRTIGVWRLVRRVGAGGMGEVYLAERAEGGFEQRSAVKMLHRSMESEAARQRFLQERQILARLDHPGVARLLDGGISNEGQPYLVLEYVEGLTLDEYCEQQGLGLRARLELFRQVCAAVAFAHSNLIIHRDLKPANVLVAASGKAKLLDFGIAKLLDEPLQGELTSATQVLLTPRYASPEQISGGVVSTGSDVYALGVMLYELVARRSPYQSTERTAAEWFRAVREEEPKPPSETSLYPWQRQLAGDLDAIIIKALEKDPERRYASVEKLDADLARHLAGQPVEARPLTALYRVERFVSRHRAAVMAAVLIVTALVAGLSVALWQAGIARREREVAERRFEQVRSLARLALFDLYDVVRDLPGGTQAQRLLITRSLDHYQRLTREAGGDPELLAEVAEGYARLGDLQGNPFTPNLGDSAEALETYRRGLALLDPAAGPGEPARAVMARAALLRKQGEVLAAAGEGERGVKYLSQALELLDSLSGRHWPALEERCSTLGTLSDFLGGLSTGVTLDYEGTLVRAEQCRRCWEDLAAREDLPEPTRRRAARGVIIGEGKLGTLATAQGRLEEGRQFIESARKRLAAVPGDEAQTVTVRRLQLWLAQEHAEVLRALNRHREALEVSESGLEAARALLASDPRNIQFEVSLVMNLYAAGLAARDFGDRSAARRYLDESLSRQEALARSDASNRSHQGRLEEIRTAMLELETP